MTMQSINVETLTPKQVIEFLDKYIIGQKQAKKSLAIVLRNRWRRYKLDFFVFTFYPLNIENESSFTG